MWLLLKNNEVLENIPISLAVDLHQVTPYGFWRHANNATEKKNTLLNIFINNFFEKELVIIIFAEL
jgi:hypothetical protein